MRFCLVFSGSIVREKWRVLSVFWRVFAFCGILFIYNALNSTCAILPIPPKKAPGAFDF